MAPARPESWNGQPFGFLITAMLVLILYGQKNRPEEADWKTEDADVPTGTQVMHSSTLYQAPPQAQCPIIR
jgi:hypothetical protein